MPLHEKKCCQRCGDSFECKMGSIMQCQCFGMNLATEQRSWLEKNYTDCLCIRCLEDIASGKKDNKLQK